MRRLLVLAMLTVSLVGCDSLTEGEVVYKYEQRYVQDDEERVITTYHLVVEQRRGALLSQEAVRDPPGEYDECDIGDYWIEELGCED